MQSLLDWMDKSYGPVISNQPTTNSVDEAEFFFQTDAMASCCCCIEIILLQYYRFHHLKVKRFANTYTYVSIHI
jgi:hypothetical protein